MQGSRGSSQEREAKEASDDGAIIKKGSAAKEEPERKGSEEINESKSAELKKSASNSFSPIETDDVYIQNLLQKSGNVKILRSNNQSQVSPISGSFDSVWEDSSSSSGSVCTLDASNEMKLIHNICRIDNKHEESDSEVCDLNTVVIKNVEEETQHTCRERRERDWEELNMASSGDVHQVSAAADAGNTITLADKDEDRLYISKEKEICNNNNSTKEGTSQPQRKKDRSADLNSERCIPSSSDKSASKNRTARDDVQRRPQGAAEEPWSFCQELLSVDSSMDICGLRISEESVLVILVTLLLIYLSFLHLLL